LYAPVFQIIEKLLTSIVLLHPGHNFFFSTQVCLAPQVVQFPLCPQEGLLFTIAGTLRKGASHPFLPLWSVDVSRLAQKCLKLISPGINKKANKYIVRTKLQHPQMHLWNLF
jgi:hypothetical protein